MSPTTSPDFLHVSQLSMTFRGADGRLEALQEINFDMGNQEFLCVLGPSGSGKSTLLRLIAGLLQPSSGSITFHGKQSSPRIGLVFQQANLMPWRSVRENVALPLELRGLPKGEIERRVEDMLELVGLTEFGGSWPAELSGGMAQRVAIGRAFIQEPDLLLLDEPFGSLDALTREKMGSELLRLWQAQRTAVLMVTHSISEALLLSDRVLVFSPRPGQILQDIPVTFTRPRREELRYSTAFQQMEQALRGSIQLDSVSTGNLK